MPRFVADALKNRFESGKIYRIGGDEFVILSEDEAADICAGKMSDVSVHIEEHDYHIAYGIASRTDEIGTERVIHEADTKMLRHKNDYYSANGKCGRNDISEP